MADELKGAGHQGEGGAPDPRRHSRQSGILAAERMAEAVPPQAIAMVIVFLRSEDASPITGPAIPAYGSYRADSMAAAGLDRAMCTAHVAPSSERSTRAIRQGERGRAHEPLDDALPLR